MKPVTEPGTDGISNYTEKAMDTAGKWDRRAAFSVLTIRCKYATMNINRKTG